MEWSIQIHSKCVSFILFSSFHHDNGITAHKVKALVGVCQQLPLSCVCVDL